MPIGESLLSSSLPHGSQINTRVGTETLPMLKLRQGGPYELMGLKRMTSIGLMGNMTSSMGFMVADNLWNGVWTDGYLGNGRRTQVGYSCTRRNLRT